MDARISAIPMALQSAWQDSGFLASRRLQPQVLGASEPFAPTPQEGTPVRSAPTDDSGIYDRFGTIGARGASAGIYAAASWSRTDSLELQVQTAEGDVVTLNFSQSSSESMAAGMLRGAETAVHALAWSSEEGAELSLQVEGDLNETERAAIDALADRVSEVADEFLDGDMDVALQMASALSLDGSDALSGFSYEMRSTEVLAASLRMEAAETLPETPPDPGVIVPAPIGSSESNNAPTASSPNARFQQLLALLDRLNADSALPALSIGA
jgi:hypothetical protein